MAVVSCALACDPCKDGSDGDVVDVDGIELYGLDYVNTGESVRIFHDGDGAIHLVHVDTTGQLEHDGQVRAFFTPEALAILEDAVAQLEGGAELGAFNPECLTYIDAPTSRLSVPASRNGLQFGYPLQCAPPLLAALDEMCRDVIMALPTCSASPWFQDCQAAD
jgi:hypothetical protein